MKTVIGSEPMGRYKYTKSAQAIPMTFVAINNYF